MSSDPAEGALVRVVDEVLAAKKYRHVLRELVVRCARDELAADRGAPNLDEAVKRTKRKLHQIYAAYLSGPARYDVSLDRLRSAVEADDENAQRQVLEQAMRHHASTRERLGTLEQVYAELEPELATASSILDLACGLNPLAHPWMGLRPDALYRGWDLDHELVGFVARTLELLEVPHACEVADLLTRAEFPEADVAFAFKVLPCLEQQRKGAGRELLARLRSPICVVSFPLKSLGGRQKGMLHGYGDTFESMLALEQWTFRRFQTPNELYYVVRR